MAVQRIHYVELWDSGEMRKEKRCLAIRMCVCVFVSVYVCVDIWHSDGLKHAYCRWFMLFQTHE